MLETADERYGNLENRFPGNKTTRLLLALIVLLILTIRFGFAPDSPDILMVGDILILAASLLFNGSSNIFFDNSSVLGLLSRKPFTPPSHKNPLAP